MASLMLLCAIVAFYSFKLLSEIVHFIASTDYSDFCKD